MKIAIALLNWNGRPLLEQFLPSVVTNSANATIYLVDNASTDDSVSFVHTHYPTIKCICLPNNYGYTGGYNRAMSIITEDIVCLLNTDIQVSDHWLHPILKIFESEAKTAAVQPKILSLHEPDTFEFAGAGGGFIDFLGYPFCRGRIFDTLEKDFGQYDVSTDIFWASGAALFIRKAIYEKMGRLDLDYFAHHEEIDLCWRIKNQGYHIKYAPESVVYHLGGATLSEQNPQKTFLNFRNSLYNVVKHTAIWEVALIIPLRLILDGLAGIHMLFLGKFAHMWAIVRAHFSFYRHLPKMIRKREQIMVHPKRKPFSIVFNYYVLRLKKFIPPYQ